VDTAQRYDTAHTSPTSDARVISDECVKTVKDTSSAPLSGADQPRGTPSTVGAPCSQNGTPKTLVRVAQHVGTEALQEAPLFEAQLLAESRTDLWIEMSIVRAERIKH
jgi:hypothetical protein